MKRRHFIQISSLAVVASGTAYTLNRGLRFPSLGLELPELSSNFLDRDTSITHQDAILVRSDEQQTRFRANVPEPKFRLYANTARKLSFIVENLSTKAQLAVTGTITVNETISGLQRLVELELTGGSEVLLQWDLPSTKNFRFAAIGDTGGGPELGWCITRAAELGADFILHLGDLNYRPEDYDLARENLLNSPIPIYVSIGNHDYRDDGIYFHGRFRTLIGPLNSEFTLGGIRFLNIDTASDFFPASSGQRGKFIRRLQINKNIRNTIAFTHRPMADPRLGSAHDIGGGGQISWLASQLKRLNCTTLLAGHIHSKAEIDHEGIFNFIAGQGLAIEDIISEQSVAEILIGNITPNEMVQFHWAPLLMPFNYHRNLEDLSTQISPEKFARLKSILPG
jgi:predicted phosphodiesterase